MFTVFGKRKLKEDKLALYFTTTTIKCAREDFKAIAEMLNSSKVFERSPQLRPNDTHPFLYILLAANLKMLPNHFNKKQLSRIQEYIFNSLSYTLDLEKDQLISTIYDYEKFIDKVNYPSKNILFGISRAVFYKYKLAEYQDEHFKHLGSPNPLIISKLNEMVKPFIWDWERFKNRYVLVSD